MMRHFVFLLILFCVACGEPTDNMTPEQKELHTQLEQSYIDVISNLNLKDLHLVEDRPEIYRALRATNNKREIFYLYCRSGAAIKLRGLGSVKPEDFYFKKVSGIAKKSGSHWVKVGTGYFWHRPK